MWRFALTVLICFIAATGRAAAADCSAGGIGEARQQFRQAYAAQDFGGAEDILNSLRNDCITEKNVDPVLAAEIASDYAIAAHRSGDDDVCIDALARYSPWQGPPTAAMAKLPERLRRGIMFNYRLCESWCAGVDHYTDAACVSLRVQQGLDKMLPGDFAEKPCPFESGGSPTLALPDGACLAVFAPPNGRAQSEDDEKDPASVCPQVARVQERNGSVVADTLDVPAKSMLRRPVLCCVPIDLAIDHGGRIEVTPSDNPPEDCHSGHRAAPQQDILRLRNARLVLEHRLDADDD
jgi:hypothetical protein